MREADGTPLGRGSRACPEVRGNPRRLSRIGPLAIIEPMFDRAIALACLEAGRCACAGCEGTLTDATLSRGGWQFCRRCRCAWKIEVIDGKRYASAIPSPAHVARVTPARP